MRTEAWVIFQCLRNKRMKSKLESELQTDRKLAFQDKRRVEIHLIFHFLVRSPQKFPNIVRTRCSEQPNKPKFLSTATNFRKTPMKGDTVLKNAINEATVKNSPTVSIR